MRNNRSVMFISAIALILLAMIPAVSAEKITHFGYDDLPFSVTYEHEEAIIDTKTIQTVLPAKNAGKTVTGSLGIVLKSVETYPEINYVFLEHDYKGNDEAKFAYNSIPTGEFTGTYNRPSDNSIQPITVYVDRYYDVLGREIGIRIIAFPQNWEIGSKTGTFYSPIEFNGKTYSYGKYRTSYAYVYGNAVTLSTPLNGGIAFKGGSGAEIPYCVGFKGSAVMGVVGFNYAKNIITIAEKNGLLEVSAVKQFDGKNHASEIGVYNKDNELITYDNKAVDVVLGRFEPDILGKVTVKVSSLSGFDYTLIYDSVVTDPTDPGDPGDPSRVMVHIIAQDARNENLLLDAAVEVRDQYDAVVAAGTTSPEGWMVFEYDLPDTLTDEDFDRYYTVSVSLPGWTQKVTNFKFWPAFIPRSGDWIRVEMLPDSSGPADPEKTYLMFFVRDIHANPLERASIEIAGQYWHTNSAGHVAVEVPKNSTTAYTVRKTGHVSISGSAAVGAEGSYVVNIALGPALPDRTPGPGDDPGATPPPRDTRTNEEKGKAVIDLIADNAELIATLAILAAVMGLINLIMPGRRRR